MENVTKNLLDIDIEKEDMRSQVLHVKFHGDNTEYFFIWIVNVLLTILTLGIYSAWATVRTRRYFLGNTEINGSRLEYHASPVSILISRIIIFFCFALYLVVNYIYLPIAYVILFLFCLMLPYFIIRSCRFHAIMTSYRNVRFNFLGSYKKGYWHFLILPLLLLLVGAGVSFLIGNIVSLIIIFNSSNSYDHLNYSKYLIGTYVTLFLIVISIYVVSAIRTKQLYEYFANNFYFGKSAFKLQMNYRAVAKIYSIAFLILLPFIILSGFSIISIAEAIAIYKNSASESEMPIFMFLFIYLYFYVGLLLSYSYIHLMMRREFFNKLEFSNELKFSSSITYFSYIILLFSNSLIIIFTLGLATPIAQIRYARYFAINTKITGDMSLENELAHDETDANSFHDETLDSFDFGLSL
ncbi:YjgN family protein [Providencia vermicola]|uniref:YjgN family protein n=1 Tax=Providencia vermicola TaxID=333965 RepID=UPI0034DD5A19